MATKTMADNDSQKENKSLGTEAVKDKYDKIKVMVSYIRLTCPYEARHDKIYLQGLQPGLTRTRLHNHIIRLEP